MKLIAIFFLILISITAAAQNNDYYEIMKDGHVLWKNSKGELLAISNDEIKLIKPKWVKAVAIWTDAEKKKELGYLGDKTLIIIDLKPKREEDFEALLRNN